MSSPAAAASIIDVGMDVHKTPSRSPSSQRRRQNPTRLERLPNDLPTLKRFLDRVARDGELRVCYAASGAGYVLHRALREWGDACDVIAPSLIPKRPGVQRKPDKRTRRSSSASTAPATSRRCASPARPRSGSVTSSAAARRSSARSSSRASTSSSSWPGAGSCFNRCQSPRCTAARSRSV